MDEPVKAFFRALECRFGQSKTDSTLITTEASMTEHVPDSESAVALCGLVEFDGVSVRAPYKE